MEVMTLLAELSQPVKHGGPIIAGIIIGVIVAKIVKATEWRRRK